MYGVRTAYMRTTGGTQVFNGWYAGVKWFRPCSCALPSDFLLEEVEVVEQRQRGEQGEGATASQVPTAASGPGPKPGPAPCPTLSPTDFVPRAYRLLTLCPAPRAAAEARTDASGRGRPASRPASGAKRATVKCSLVLVSSQVSSLPRVLV